MGEREGPELKQEMEVMEISQGILYKADGNPVDTSLEDGRYRRAYYRMHLRHFAWKHIWPADGIYVLIGDILTPVARE